MTTALEASIRPRDNARRCSIITHAAYSTAYPLPALRGFARAAPIGEPPVGIGRVHRLACHADAEHKRVDQATYVAALSKTEWRGTAHLSVALDIGAEVAKNRMLGPAMSAITEVRRSKKGTYEWRLR